MVKKLSYSIILILVAVNAKIYTQEIYFNIEQVIDKGIEKNHNIKLQFAKYEELKGNLIYSESDFNTIYSFEITRDKNYVPNTIAYRNGWLNDTVSKFETNDLTSYTISSTHKFTTGTQLTAGTSFTNYGKDQNYYDLNNAGYGSYITGRSKVFLNIYQPLLKNYGRKANFGNVLISRLNLNAQSYQYFYEASLQILQIVNSYLNYLSTYKNLTIEIKLENSYNLIISQLKKLAEMDNIPVADITIMKAWAALQDSYRIQAEESFNNAQNTLASLLGININMTDTGNLKVPADNIYSDSISMPDTSGYIYYWMNESLNNRFDLKAQHLLIEAAQTKTEVLKNQSKPQIDLNFNLGYNGIYESDRFDRFYKPLYYNIPGVNIFLGLSFTITPKFTPEKGLYIESLGQMQQQVETKNELLRQIKLDNINFFKQIMFYKEALKYSKQAVDYNEKAINNEYTKLKLGTSTVINVIQLQNNYATALRNYYNGLQNLYQAIVNFRYSTGTLITVVDEKTFTVNSKLIFSLPEANSTTQVTQKSK